MIKRISFGIGCYLERNDKFFSRDGYSLNLTGQQIPAHGRDADLANQAIEAIQQNDDWQKAVEILEQGGLVPVYTEK